MDNEDCAGRLPIDPDRNFVVKTGALNLLHSDTYPGASFIRD